MSVAIDRLIRLGEAVELHAVEARALDKIFAGLAEEYGRPGVQGRTEAAHAVAAIAEAFAAMRMAEAAIYAALAHMRVAAELGAVPLPQPKHIPASPTTNREAA